MRREGRLRAADRGESCQAGPRALRDAGEARAHEGTIDADKRHDIAHRCKTNEIDRAAQIRLGDALRRVPTAFAQSAIERYRKKKRDAGRTEITETGLIAGLIGIDVRQSRRRRVDTMMIEHDHVEPGIARRLKRRRSARAAIDRDDKAGAFRLELQQRACRRAVPFHPVSLQLVIADQLDPAPL